MGLLLEEQCWLLAETLGSCGSFTHREQREASSRGLEINATTSNLFEKA